MSNTTNIEDLSMPTSAPQQNVTMNVQQAPSQNGAQPPPPPPASLQQGGGPMGNVQGINQVIQNQPLQMPSRDIPMNQGQHTSDPNVQPNYVPPPQPQQMNYIQEFERLEAMKERQESEVERKDKLDMLFEEFQFPCLASLLFMIFQLPVIDQKMRLILPSLFLADGNTSFSGMIVKALIFLAAMILCQKSITFLAE